MSRFFSPDMRNKTSMVEAGMAAMWVEARKKGRQHATLAGVAFSCYPNANGAILWRANGYNYSRKALSNLLVNKARLE